MAVLYASPNLPIHPALPFSPPHCVHKSALYVSVSIPALQLGPSVLFPGECGEIGNPLATLLKLHYVYICLYISSLPSSVECTE